MHQVALRLGGRYSTRLNLPTLRGAYGAPENHSKKYIYIYTYFEALVLSILVAMRNYRM